MDYYAVIKNHVLKEFFKEKYRKMHKIVLKENTGYKAVLQHCSVLLQNYVYTPEC